MSGSSFGRLFKVTTFGESHGPALGCIVDGCPPGLVLDEARIQGYLDKRRPGTSRYTSQRRETDKVEILSGVFEGKTTGTPIALCIRNQDARSADYEALKNLYRPGHADFTYQAKYGHRDYRGGGRASARETAARVAAGAIARLYLEEHFGLRIKGHLAQIGDLVLSYEREDAIDTNPFFCPNDAQIPAIAAMIDTLRKEGDSIGALVAVQATGVPAGLGEPVFDKLDALLAQAMMSINAVKAVEIGEGVAVTRARGSQHRDEMDATGFLSNHAGGILGGISTGEPIQVRLALKPTPSITIPGRTVTTTGEEITMITKGRHDPCVGIRAVPIAEAMMALCLMDCVLRQRVR